jgi:trk system potassium uptake protein TrkH
MRYRIVFYSLSRIFGVLALAMVMPYLLTFVYHEPQTYHFLIPIILLIGMGLYSVLSQGSIKELNLKESMLIVAAAWVGVSFFGSLPYLLDHVLSSFTDAYFETLSGFTATGSTVLPDIESVPKSVLFWRSETHWLGGMGIVVLAIAIFPALQGKRTLFSSEAPVPFTEEDLFPRIADVAKSYWKVYLFFTVVEILLLLPVMGWFDAVTHSFATIAGGGFSTRNASIGAFNSAYVEIVVMVFMIIGATSFILHFNALRGKFYYWKNTAFKIFMGILLSASVLIALNIYILNQQDISLITAFRKASFQVVSIITTTGFATTDFKYWPSYSVFVLLLLMFIGGMSASTSGSIKVSRFEIIFKDFRRMLHQTLHPRAVAKVWSNRKTVRQNVILKVQVYAITYILVFIISGVLLVAQGYRWSTSFSAVAATLGNVGPGIGAVGPFDNFALLSSSAKWILMFDMLLGRLEIWTVLSLFIPEFWGLG